MIMLLCGMFSPYFLDLGCDLMHRFYLAEFPSPNYLITLLISGLIPTNP